MNALDIIVTALHSLGSSKLRSGLTLLGIIIGITAVTVLMSIGRGVQENITSRIQSQGTNLLFVRPKQRRWGLDPHLAGRGSAHRPDIRAIHKGCRATDQL